LLAGALYMVDPLELLSTSVVPICFVAADSDAPAPAAIEISVASVSATTKDEGLAQLFGMDTEPVDDGALLDKWRRVQADITKDLEVVAQCQAGMPCPAPAQRLIRRPLALPASTAGSAVKALGEGQEPGAPGDEPSDRVRCI